MPTGNLQVIINAIDKKIEDIQKAHPIPVSFTDQEKVFMSGIKERWQSKFNDIGFCGRDARMLEFFRSRDFTELCKNRELLEKIFTVEARGETYPTEYVKMSSEAIDVTLGSILRFGLKATESTDWLEIGTENADGGLEINGTKSEEREKLAQERRKRYQENTAPALQNLATALGVQDEFNTAEPKSDYSGNLLGRWENIKKFLLETIDDNDAVILAGKILFVPNYTPGSMADQAHWWMRDTFGGQDGSSNIKHINLQHAATISEHVAEECTLNNVTNVDDFVQKILNEHLLLDEWFGHMVTDRAHLIALMYADYPEYVGTDGSRFKMRDAISKLCKEVQDNKDKYPLEYEQLMVRLSKVEGDLERKTNDYEKKFDKSSLSPEPEPVPEEEDEEEEEPKTIDESLDALLAQIKSDIDQNAHSTVLAKLSEIVNALQEKDIDKPTVQKILDLNDKLNQFATLNSITPSGLDKQQLKKLATDTTKGIIVQNKLATEELLESATIAELKSALAAAQKEYDDSPEKTGEVAGKFQKSRDNIYNASLGINSTIPAQVHGAAFFDIDEALFIAVRWCACNDAKNKYATSNKQVKDIKVYKNTIDGKCDLEVPILRLTEIRNEFNIEVLAELKKVIEKDGKISDGDDIETILELNRKLEKDQPGSGLSSELFEKLLAKNDDAVKLMLSDTHAQKVIKFEQVYAIKKDINTFNYYYNYLISVNRGEITAPTREQLGLLLKELPSSFPDYCFPQLKVISTVVNSKLLLPLVTKDCLESLKTAISSSSAKIKAEWGYGNNGEKLLSKIEERLKELAVAESKTVKIPAEINKSFDGKPAFPNQLQYNRINEYYMPYKVGGGAILAEAQAEIMLRDIKALLAQNPDLKIAITYSANDNESAGIYKSYQNASYQDLKTGGLHINGGGQAPTFEILQKAILEDAELRKKVDILPVTTVMHTGGDVTKHLELVKRDMKNIAEHLGKGYMVLGLTNQNTANLPNKFAIGGKNAASYWRDKPNGPGIVVDAIMEDLRQGKVVDVDTAFSKGPKAAEKEPVKPEVPKVQPKLSASVSDSSNQSPAVLDGLAGAYDQLNWEQHFTKQLGEKIKYESKAVPVDQKSSYTIGVIKDQETKTELATIEKRNNTTICEFQAIESKDAKEKARLISKQQAVGIAFLENLEKAVLESDKVITVEANGFPPKDLQAILELIKTQKILNRGSIDIKLPENLDDCKYIAGFEKDGKTPIEKKYTQEEYEALKKTITDTMHPHALAAKKSH